MKETAAKVTEVASRTRAGRAAEQLKKEWEIAAVGLPKVRPVLCAAVKPRSGHQATLPEPLHPPEAYLPLCRLC